MTPSRLQQLLPDAFVVGIDVPYIQGTWLQILLLWKADELLQWRDRTKGKTVYCYPCPDRIGPGGQTLEVAHAVGPVGPPRLEGLHRPV